MKINRRQAGHLDQERYPASYCCDGPYVLTRPEIASAIIGFGAVEHVEEAVRFSVAPS